VLEGRFVRLGALQPERDAADLFAPTHGPGAESLWAYLSTGPFRDEDAMAADLRSAAASPDLIPFGIRSAFDGRTLGRASYMRIEQRHRVIEIGGILFGPGLARAPGGTEAIWLLARHAFEALGFRRLEWKCDALNAPSRAAALRLGFVFEGVFAKHMIIKGRSRDTAWYAMTEDDWPRAKAAFEAWLAPDNFDPDGRQRRRLAELREESDARRGFKARPRPPAPSG
jgi:RimJ/RimL family protein N-acetyltransferase